MHASFELREREEIENIDIYIVFFNFYLLVISFPFFFFVLTERLNAIVLYSFQRFHTFDFIASHNNPLPPPSSPSPLSFVHW